MGASIEAATVTVWNTIVADNTEGAAVACEYRNFDLHSCDVYGNAGGGWVACIESQLGVAGNISVDPLFCRGEMGDFRLQECSRCSEGEQPDRGLIGALGIGCAGPSATQPSRWGLVKSLFRPTRE
jgi:hypothetical protein